MLRTSTIPFLFVLLLSGPVLSLGLAANTGGGVNQDGDTPPDARFRELYPASEGLALARTDGLFGYVDSSGSWVIPPWFDYGEPFIDSVAIAYINARPYLINRRGLVLSDRTWASVVRLAGDRFTVESRDGMKGVIDRRGRTVIPPVYDSILVPDGGPLALTLIRQDAPGFGLFSVVDSSGRSVVQEGEYASIARYVDGYAWAYRRDGGEVMLDRGGRECFSLPASPISRPWSFVYGASPRWGFMVVKRATVHNAPALQEFGLIDSSGTLLVASPAKRTVLKYLRERVPENEWPDLEPWLDGDEYHSYGGEVRRLPRWNRGEGTEGRMNISYMRESDYPLEIVLRGERGSVPVGEPYTPDRSLEKKNAPSLELQSDSGRYELLVNNPTSRDIIVTHTPLPLSLTLQARDASGRWQDIEYESADFVCLTGSVPVYLRPHSRLRYTTPAFEGAIPTRLRAALRYQEVGDPETMVRTLHSREIPVTINPGQFWRRMD